MFLFLEQKPTFFPKSRTVVNLWVNDVSSVSSLKKKNHPSIFFCSAKHPGILGKGRFFCGSFRGQHDGNPGSSRRALPAFMLYAQLWKSYSLCQRFTLNPKDNFLKSKVRTNTSIFYHCPIWTKKQVTLCAMVFERLFSQTQAPSAFSPSQQAKSPGVKSWDPYTSPKFNSEQPGFAISSLVLT